MTVREQLAQFAAGSKPLGALCREYRSERAVVHLEGAWSAGRSFYASAAVARTGGVHLFVAEDRDAAAYLVNDFYNLLDEERVCFFSLPPTSIRRPTVRRMRRASCSARRR